MPLPNMEIAARIQLAFALALLPAQVLACSCIPGGLGFCEKLPEAYRNPGQERWQVSSCSRTRALADATEDLRVLRAWKSGLRLPGRIQGYSGSREAGIKVTLLVDKQAETVTDSNGMFEFANLEAGNYEVEATAALRRARTVDLTHAWCAQVFLLQK